MKRLSTIIMALALVLGMSQCKKQETPTNGDSGEKVHITLNVNNGESLAVNVNDNGGRHAVAPSLGVIQFRDDDILYVGYNGHYIGYLTYENGVFDGNLEAPEDGVNDQLHFYFLGGKGPKVNTIEDEENLQSFNISIANQTDTLPVLCYGKSNERYETDGSYTASLAYKCALVKFNLNKATDYKCTLSNMPTEAEISFATTTEGFTPIAKTSTKGNIDLYAEEGNWGVRWAILLKGTNLTSGDNDLITTDYEGSAVLENLNDNDYINSGITLKNPVFAAPGALYAVKNSDGELTRFSVNDSTQVYFSRANLKCSVVAPASTTKPAWSFHTNQFDECPGYKSNTSGSSNTAVPLSSTSEMDRYSWGLLSPTTVSENDWVNGSRNLNWNDSTDWGCALQGTAYGDHWRTLTAAEWEYLLKRHQTRHQTHSFLRVAWKQMGFPNWTIATVCGIIIAPDGYEGPSYDEWNDEGSIHKFGSDLNSVNALLNAGCVFLPALGYRNGSNYYEYNYHYNPQAADGSYMYGNYWTATGAPQPANSSQIPQARAFRFDRSSITYEYYSQRHLGMCVRLVWDAN